MLVLRIIINGFLLGVYSFTHALKINLHVVLVSRNEMIECACFLRC